MKLFLDSANLGEIEEAFTIGLAEGVNTSLVLIKKEMNSSKKNRKKINLDEYMTEIFVSSKGQVNIDVTKTDAVGIVNEGKRLYERYHVLANNVVIKVPINTSLTGKNKNTEGLRAVRLLNEARIPVNCTLIFTPEQALFAAKAGARYVSLGESSDSNELAPNLELVRKTSELFKMHGIKTEIVANGIKSTEELREVALAGANVIVVPFKVINDILINEKTQKGMKIFTSEVFPEYSKLSDKK